MLEINADDRVLVIGATGFIGQRLVSALMRKKIKLRLLVRDPDKASFLFPENAGVEIFKGDLLNNEGLGNAFKGIHTAYYLIHSMGGQRSAGGTGFASNDRISAGNFVSAADASGLKRVIYLGGLGEEGDNLSEHLKSRREVARILESGKASETFLRAAVIIGAGGASYEMLRYLVERLPLMICPKWIDTRIQPIAVKDVISYLTGCLFNGKTSGRQFDIGGPEILTYREMMQNYAAARGLAERVIFKVPLLTPHLSSYWVNLVTPVPAGIATPLIEGLKNEVICRDNSIDSYIKILKTPFKDAVRIAFSEEREGPGVTGF